MTSLQKNHTFLDTFSKSTYNQPMSAASYSCIFSSPKTETIFQETSLILLPGLQGKVGILPHHSPMVIMLKPGITHVYKGSSILESFFISGGTAHITSDSCRVLVDTFIVLNELDPLIVENNLKRYHNDLAGLSIEAERRWITSKIALAEAMVDVIRNGKHKK
jgi:F-type H+-transporting ATPase subunit epsilon